MTVKSILDGKGHDVFTMAPSDSLKDAIKELAQRRIGALVVTDGDRRIAGILSERDIVRAVARDGANALNLTVGDVMTSKVRVCAESNTIIEVMETMTAGRFRHVPVERDGALVGIVSIGDVVKRRIEDAVREADEIKQYIATA